MSVHVNDRRPNFRNAEGRFFLVRCFACQPARGCENLAMSVYRGVCAWCGWSAEQSETDDKDPLV